MLSPAPSGTSFSVLHGNGKGTPIRHAEWGVVVQQTAPGIPSEGECQTGPFRFLRFSRKASWAGKKLTARV